VDRATSGWLLGLSAAVLILSSVSAVLVAKLPSTVIDPVSTLQARVLLIAIVVSLLLLFALGLFKLVYLPSGRRYLHRAAQACFWLVVVSLAVPGLAAATMAWNDLEGFNFQWHAATPQAIIVISLLLAWAYFGTMYAKVSAREDTAAGTSVPSTAR
jgi:hypothetical protein